MERLKVVIRGGLALLLGVLWLSLAEADEEKVECPQDTIQKAVNEAKPGDTILVSGVCNENVVVPEEIHRITLDGQGTATIIGAPGVRTVTVRGRIITIRGFTITGGRDGIAVSEGGSAEIVSNLIENTRNHGVFVTRHSSAEILNNTIRNNPANGIFVNDHSLARMGFSGFPGARVRRPNLIENNEVGVNVNRNSTARIIGNDIINNTRDGVSVRGGSQADIADNTIDGNGRDGIFLLGNSGAELGTDAAGATPAFDDDTNTGANGRFGLRCAVDGYARGAMGALTGATAQQSFAAGCFDNVTP